MRNGRVLTRRSLLWEVRGKGSGTGTGLDKTSLETPYLGSGGLLDRKRKISDRSILLVP